MDRQSSSSVNTTPTGPHHRRSKTVDNNKWHDSRLRTPPLESAPLVKKFVIGLIGAALGLAFVLSLPTLFLVAQTAACSDPWRYPNINKEVCRCACWDGKAKGCYSRLSGTGGEYRHIFFNQTGTSLYIVVISCVMCILGWTFFTKLFGLLVTNWRHVSFLTFVSIGSLVFPIFSGWWQYFNYLNDTASSIRLRTEEFYLVTYIAAAVCLYYTLDDSVRLPLRLWLFLFWVPLSIFHTQFWTFISAFRMAAAERTSVPGRVIAYVILNTIVAALCAIRLVRIYRTNRAGNWLIHLVISLPFVAIALLWFYLNVFVPML